MDANGNYVVCRRFSLLNARRWHLSKRDGKARIIPELVIHISEIILRWYSYS